MENSIEISQVDDNTYTINGIRVKATGLSPEEVRRHAAAWLRGSRLRLAGLQ